MLKLGIPKGSLETATIDLFAAAGWTITTRSRHYFPSINDDEIECALVKAKELGGYVADQTLDIGLTGLDWIHETAADVEIIADLNYSKSSNHPCRWVVVVHRDSEIQSLQDLQGKTVATELLETTKKVLADNNIDANVVFSWGATEAKVVEGLADAAVEITETGSTIRAHGLRIVCDLFETHTVLVANKESLKDPVKRDKINKIALLLESALAAQEKVLLKMNIPADKKSALIDNLPSLQAPTINKLDNVDWFAVETVVDKSAVRDLVPLLKEHGAEGILEFELRKLVR